MAGGFFTLFCSGAVVHPDTWVEPLSVIGDIGVVHAVAVFGISDFRSCRSQRGYVDSRARSSLGLFF